MTEKEIGNYIRYYRRLRQISQFDLAKSTGLSRTSIQRLEAGVDGTSLGVLLRVAEVFNLKFDLSKKS